jgi:hypothetical protein
MRADLMSWAMPDLTLTPSRSYKMTMNLGSAAAG